MSAEVQNTLENIDARKSPGWDGLSPKILKITAKGLAPALTSMYNNCISLSQRPTPTMENGRMDASIQARR